MDDDEEEEEEVAIWNGTASKWLQAGFEHQKSKKEQQQRQAATEMETK